MRRPPAPTSRPPVVGAVRWAVAVLAVVGIGALVTSCSGERPSLGMAPIPPVDATSTSTTTSTTAPGTTTSTTVPEALGPDDLLGYIATPTDVPQVHTEPDQAAPTVAVPTETALGAPTVFAVIGDPTTASPEHPGWVHVLLPVEPNATTAWVPSGSVTVSHTSLRIFVDLEGRELRVEDDGAERLRATVAVGTEENPTPTGATYVTELVDNVEPGGAYGPWALGLALHSETLSEFAGGPGQVGIHGTNRPELIGQRVSSGCVRLANEDIESLVDLQLPLGVPVFIT